MNLKISPNTSPMNMLNTQDFDNLNEQLNQWAGGNKQVEAELIKKLYPFIHQIARNQFKNRDVNALQTTEIISEAFIKLRNSQALHFDNKKQFFALISKVIRNIAISQYRAECSQKRGGAERNLTLDRFEEVIEEPGSVNENILELDEWLTELDTIDSSAAQVVECKVFGGMTIPEMADALEVSESTISRNWKFARLWLLSKMNQNDSRK